MQVIGKLLPGNSSTKIWSQRLNWCVSTAYFLFVPSEVLIEPWVEVFSNMKDNSPVKIVPTDQVGFQLSGWKSDIDKHSFVWTLNRPLGVIIYTEGGLNGNFFGNTSFPW
jgi:hypothetical protein